MKELFEIITVKGLTWKHHALTIWLCLNLVTITGVEHLPWYGIIALLISFAANAYFCNKVTFPDNIGE